MNQFRMKNYPQEIQNRIVSDLTQQAIRQFPFQLNPKDSMLQEKIYNMIMSKQFQVNWQQMADPLKLTRWQVYHWYHESYARNCFSQRITNEDKVIIRQEVMKALITDSPMDRQFQQTLKMRLSKNYNRSEFSMVYNNLLRSKEIKRIQELKGYASDSRISSSGVAEDVVKFGLLHLWETSIQVK
ncbi:Conserved_hypothetical protein [Hexamita inflata]|uniref:Uncharacterized protein n=1 Tax=Hexamita inflata TaxID=28002 RepID=A0AA86NT44_9EUKA|nr:Conserved hypothetical protein [Hexamita inflata]CAI9924977.1 Conserved hypothetical protein [Hexamita inflata]CAI9945374.1 Conserved hypothetical protein [Hexamita inflata]CAI9964008.1 Conserved hypothetical protein [Hexamita inflata]